MKNILYICAKNHYDWDAIVPSPETSSTGLDISVLLLQDGKNLSTIPSSHVSILKPEGERFNAESAHTAISYQDFLEKIFLMDLAVMI